MTTATATKTTITATEIQMGIEHSKQVIAAWDEAVEETAEPVATDADVAAAQERVAKMFAEINAMTKVTTQAAKPTPTVRNVSESWLLKGQRGGALPGRGTEPAAPKAAAPAEVAQAVDVMIEQVDAKLNENATEAEPGPIEEPVALRPVCPEQKAYFVKFVLNSDQTKTYAMLFRKSDGLAVGCECKSRKFHHGVACKHMRNHNAMLAKPAEKATQAA